MTDRASVRYDAPRRRVTDDSELARVTGYANLRSLMVNVLGGLTIASIVGALSVWGTQAVLGEQVTSLSRQVQALREDLRDMRRDLYQPRWRDHDTSILFGPAARIAREGAP